MSRRNLIKALRARLARKGRRRMLAVVVALVLIMIVARGCKQLRERGTILPRDPTLVLVTGYCNCGKCCGWKSDESTGGKPVYDYGKMKGKEKRIGITATGTTARHGTIAADPKVFPFGTNLGIPGYGVGTVEDVGGSIRGRHIDIWFPSHEEARKWGARWLHLTRLKHR